MAVDWIFRIRMLALLIFLTGLTSWLRKAADWEGPLTATALALAPATLVCIFIILIP